MNETERRIERRIASASIKHMSNAKWRKFFAALHDVLQPPHKIGLKFVGQDHVFIVPVPGPHFENEDNFGECGGISYALFAHIEFVRISRLYPVAGNATNNVEALIKHLNNVGRWSIQASDDDVFILGYEWPPHSDGN